MGDCRCARAGLHELVVARPLRLNRLPPALQHRRSKIASHVRAVATWSRARSERGAPSWNMGASRCNTAPRPARPAPSSALPAGQRCDREIGSDCELGSAHAHRVVARSEIAASDSIMRAGAARAAACARESPALGPRPAGVGAGGRLRYMPTSATELGSPVPYRHRDWAHPRPHVRPRRQVTSPAGTAGVDKPCEGRACASSAPAETRRWPCARTSERAAAAAAGRAGSAQAPSLRAAGKHLRRTLAVGMSRM